MKTSPSSKLVWAPLSVVALAGSAGCTQAVTTPDAEPGDEIAAACVPEVPPVLAVPAGNKLAFVYDAVGVQIYGCDSTATGYVWVFRAPEATLYGPRGKLAGTHYAGPTWQSNDGSTVVAAKLAEYPADSGSIPWLLLGATTHGGQGRMSNVAFIQRLETTAGKAPVTGCDAAHVGETARVDYTATYYFYEPRSKK